MTKKVIGVIGALALSWIASACDDDAISGPGFTCDVTNPVREVRLLPTSATMIIRVPARATDVLQLSAVALNRVGNARTDVPIDFSSSDTSIATVDSTGLVHAKRPGTLTVKASTCGETASSQITIVAAAITVQAVAAAQAIVADDSVLVTARALTQTGETLSGVKFSFAVSPASSATVKIVSDSTAYIFAKTAGTLTVTASGEGTSGSAAITVLPRSFLSGSTTAVGLDAGSSYACGLITLGRGFCWGLNDHSQLGATTDSVCFDNTLTHTDTTEDQTVVRPCSLLPRRLALDTAFASISAGDSSACAIGTNGRAYCWGTNTHGELGDGSNGLRGKPTLVTPTLSFTAISVGGAHACALAVGGAAYCWGQDLFGQLGDARLINSSTPIPVSSGGQDPAIFSNISAGSSHTCALTADGTAFCWGGNASGQLGTGGVGGFSDTPASVSTGARFTSISSGGDHTCAIAVGGAAFCWGSNAFGQLGTGAPGSPSANPLAVSGGQTYTRISAGSRHTCALTTAGVVYCWGDNQDLQLGRGPSTGSALASGTPAPVSGGQLPAGLALTTVSAGFNHTCAVGSDGFGYCWGSNVFGALGNTLQAAFRGFPQRVATPR